MQTCDVVTAYYAATGKRASYKRCLRSASKNLKWFAGSKPQRKWRFPVATAACLPWQSRPSWWVFVGYIAFNLVHLGQFTCLHGVRRSQLFSGPRSSPTCKAHKTTVTAMPCSKRCCQRAAVCRALLAGTACSRVGPLSPPAAVAAGKHPCASIANR